MANINTLPPTNGTTTPPDPLSSSPHTSPVTPPTPYSTQNGCASASSLPLHDNSSLRTKRPADLPCWTSTSCRLTDDQRQALSPEQRAALRYAKKQKKRNPRRFFDFQSPLYPRQAPEDTIVGHDLPEQKDWQQCNDHNNGKERASGGEIDYDFYTIPAGSFRIRRFGLFRRCKSTENMAHSRGQVSEAGSLEVTWALAWKPYSGRDAEVEAEEKEEQLEEIVSVRPTREMVLNFARANGIANPSEELQYRMMRALDPLSRIPGRRLSF